MTDNGSGISSTFAAVVECAAAPAGAAIAHVSRTIDAGEAAQALAAARHQERKQHE